jgi:ribosome-associated protein
MTLDSLELARRIVDVMVEKQAEDILLLDLREVSILADYFVIGTATSERQAQAVTEGIRVATKEGLDVRPIHVEGESSSGWVLLDYGSVVAHVFAPDARKYYDLEGFWRSGRVVVRLI